MVDPNPVFEQNYQHYLKKIQCLDLDTIAQKLGLSCHESKVMIKLFNTEYTLSERGFRSGSDKSAPYDHCIVMCRHLLMCPRDESQEKQMVSFKDFKDSGPLTVYFATAVEQNISRFFAGRKQNLAEAARNLGGYAPGIDAGYDVSIRFDALPKIPMVMLFNDQDDEFDAQTGLLFEQRAEHYLDAECLAILGHILFQKLAGINGPGT